MGARVRPSQIALTPCPPAPTTGLFAAVGIDTDDDVGHTPFRGRGELRLKILLTEEEIRDGVRRLAAEIRETYADRALTAVGVLTGSMILLADLIRLIDLPMQVGLVQASSYRGPATRPGPLVVQADMLPDLRGRDVLLIDDIFDTGRTLFELIQQIDDLQPRTVRSAVLLRKQGRQEVLLEPDHVAFEIPNEFVVGYGLDYNGQYRNLPYVAVLEPHELNEGRHG